ncbi:MAG: alkaline phosphatase family protein [Prolixibacteraceae bacterium]|nr:alkaline phosphatase family protein [Prolixibacteraceae bacterium]
MNRQRKKVLLLGWDAADWKIINRLMDEGQMPATKYLIENGVMGNISTLTPAYSPMLWTSIATGKYADKHGILGFSEPTPDHSGIRPVSTSSRKVKALWNILTQEGYKTHVVNWWPSFPAEPVNGIYVSNMFPKIASLPIDRQLLPDDTVHPPDLQNLFAHFRVHPLELTAEHILPFIPDLEMDIFKIEKKTEVVAKLIAEASSVHAAATLALEQEEWDFAAIYWDTIDHFCHAFMNYSPPQMKGIKDEDYKLYKHVVDGAYRLMDMMLGRLLQMIDKNCTVILISDHGFKSGHLRSMHTPNEPAGPAHHHRDVGIFCAMGPDIHKDEMVYGVSLLDIAPTILSIFGVPVGEDMDGKPLLEIFQTPPVVKTIPTWEAVPGECGMLPDEKRDLDPAHSAQAIKQLIELGYIEDPGKDTAEAIEKTVDELNYNLAQVYVGTNKNSLAKPLLEKLFEKNPYRGRYVFKLVNCYLEEGLLDGAIKIIEKFKIHASKKILTKEQIERAKNRKVPEILNHKEKQQWIRENKINPVKESMQAKSDLFSIKIVEGDILLKQGKPRKALQKYREMEKDKPKTRKANYQMGNAFLKLRQWKDAETLFRNVIEFDPDHQNAWLGMGICCYKQERYDEALDLLINAASLNFYNPVTHFNIGRVLSETGKFEDAANSFETALKINPNFGLARNMLIGLLENQLKDSQKAKLFKAGDVEQPKDEFSSTQEDLIIKPSQEKTDSTPIIVVSGLPRSGTSMMMQLLENAGIPVYTDEARKADESNPKGYYEHEKVKQLVRNSKWLGEAKGKAIKIVLPLLYKIPASLNYKVILMKRDMEEIIESQHRMLVNSGKIKEGTYAPGIEEIYRKYVDKMEGWAQKNKNIELLEVDYNQALANPTEIIHRVTGFLKLEKDTKILSKSIDPKLYRTKNEKNDEKI